MMILRRFGFTSAKSKRALEQFVSIASKHECIPSLFVTGDLLDHNRRYFQELAERNVSIGLHGHHHVDHALLTESIQRKEIRKALDKFRHAQITIRGFRSPYLRFSKKTLRAVHANNLAWTSNMVMYYYPEPFIRKCDMNCANRLVEQFYTPLSITDQPSIPFFVNGYLEMPVALPDDEILIDRFNMTDPYQLADVWLWMLNYSRNNGEFLNLIFHPERLPFFGKALDIVLEKARAYGDVWTASLDHIARWWEKKAHWTFEIEKTGPKVFEVTTECDEQAAVMLQYPNGKSEIVNDHPGKKFVLETECNPVIGCPPNCSGEGLAWLKNEGFFVKSVDDPVSCAFYFDERQSNPTPRKLLKSTYESAGPILRFARWPKGYASALSITTDVDAINLLDFIRRAHYFCSLA